MDILPARRAERLFLRHGRVTTKAKRRQSEIDDALDAAPDNTPNAPEKGGPKRSVYQGYDST